MATPFVCFTTTSKQQQTLVTNIMRDTLSQNPREALNHQQCVRVKGNNRSKKKSKKNNKVEEFDMAISGAISEGCRSFQGSAVRVKGNKPKETVRVCGRCVGTPVLSHIYFFLFHMRLQEREFFSLSLPS